MYKGLTFTDNINVINTSAKQCRFKVVTLK